MRELDAAVERAKARLRERDPGLAVAIDAEEVGGPRLSEEQRARLDAFLTGTGYLVAGRRVDPASVVVFAERSVLRDPGDVG